MTPAEATAAVDQLARAFRARMDTDTRQTWAEALRDLNPAAATAAIDQLARSEERLPSIAAIRRAAQGLGPATPATTRYQVLVTWADQHAHAFADPSRWHTSERNAWAAFHSACTETHPGRYGTTVELVRHRETEAAITIEQFPKTETGAHVGTADTRAALEALAASKRLPADLADPCTTCGAPATSYDPDGTAYCPGHQPEATP